MLSVFNRYAHHEHLGERYMTPNEFLQDYLGYLKYIINIIINHYLSIPEN